MTQTKTERERMMKKVLKKRGRKKKLYSVRIRLNGTVFEDVSIYQEERRSRNDRVHRPAPWRRVSRCLKIFNVRTRTSSYTL